MLAWVKRATGTAGLTSIYAIVEFIARRSRVSPRHRNSSDSVILIIATFHNTNWVHSHIQPIARARLGRVVVICDPTDVELPNVTFVSPGRIAEKMMSRAVARLFLALRIAKRENVSHAIGYHFFPAAITALVCKARSGCKAIYQSTGGVIEIQGGGWNSENRILRLLGSPSSIVQERATRLLPYFDHIVGRGDSIKNLVGRYGCVSTYTTILGSVKISDVEYPLASRDIDIVFVGRIAESKRVDRLIDTAALLVQILPHLKVAIVGDGDLRHSVEARIGEECLSSTITMVGRVERVHDWLTRSRIFVLTSRTEGVSIAMLEAMAVGCVPVVSDVGDLSTVVSDGENGYLVPQDDIRTYVERTQLLLSDQDQWQKMSSSARRAVRQRAGKDAVALKWRHLLNQQEMM